jgi:hypothetical protein
MRLLQLPTVLFMSIAFVMPTSSSLKASSSDTGTNTQQTKAKGQTKALHQAAIDVSQNEEESSCRGFVQKFYDWYWNQFADKPGAQNLDSHSIEDALKLRPSVLSPELMRSIKKEEDEMRASGQIGNLDFDPFLNSQDMSGKFLVTSVHVSNGICRTTVKGSSEVRPELKKSGSTWIFVNFHYSFYSEDGKKKRFPDNDLMHILNR